MAYFIGIDVGTSGAKCALFDQNGTLCASVTKDYPMTQPQNGWAEEDPDDWVRAVVQGISEVLTAAGIPGDDVAGVGVSGQMHGLVLLDKDDKVLRRAILWCDQRTVDECGQMHALVGEKRLRDITFAPAMTGFTASKILWVKNHEPEVYEKCRSILLPKDYVRFFLTGEKATDVSDASGMQLLDIGKRDWSRELTDRLSIDRSLLARVYESCEIAGSVTRSAAKQTGLRAGTPVVAGAGDNAAAAVGCGAVRDGKAFVTIGTSGVVYAHTKELHADPLGRIHTFCSAVPGEWHVMGVTQAAGLSLKWFRDTFCDKECRIAAKQNEDVYALMDRMAEQIPSGSDRLFFLPYLMGERTPYLDPFARGCFVGISAMHTKAHFIRAVMEGVTFSLMDCLAVFHSAGVKPESMTACGGGARSGLWRQMLADGFGCSIRTAASAEGGALGDAILAAVGTGTYRSVPEACEAVLSYQDQKVPDSAAGERFRAYYEIYRQLYAALRESFQSIASLS